MLIALFIVGWLACSVAAAGILFADYQGKFPKVAAEMRREQMGSAWSVSLMGGPVALLVSFFDSGFCEHGWRLK